jgi:two-component system chemotaxis sensor kinase CheA
MDAILEQFLSEARENLSYLDENLKDIQNTDEEGVNALFRAAHTLKGGAGLVEFNAVKEITHAAEDLLDAYRQKSIDYDDEIVDVLYDAFDEVIELIDAAEEIGSVNIDIDEEKIKSIKDEIRSYLTSDTPQTDSFEIPFNIDQDLAISHLFSHDQAAKITKYASFDETKLTKEFLEDKNYWLIELDLDIDTLKLGNDPMYLFYLLGEDNLISFATKVNCEALKYDLSSWVSRIVAVIKANADEIEDTFFNIIDEINFRPLNIRSLFESEYKPDKDNETYDLFKKEIADIIKSKKFELFDEKLSAITQILNPRTKEGFVLTRLQAILPNFDVGSDEYQEVIKTAFEILEIKIALSLDKKDDKTNANDTSNLTKTDDKLKNSAITILKAQQKVLAFSKDQALFSRTKKLLESVLGFLKDEYKEKLYQVNSIQELKSFVDSLIDKFEEKATTTTIQQTDTKKRSTATEKPKQQMQKADIKSQPMHISKTVKIEQHQIDELMDIVGELLVLKNSLPYIANSIAKEPEIAKRELINKYEQISRLTDTLQDRAMGMRLLPLSYIFDRYPKLIRDISKKLGKKIKYEEEGKETKLDKAMIEKLADPLVHIIRNSLDHGLESEEERIASQKDPVGTIRIEARSEGDKVFITIADDGRGIDENKIVSKALEKNLIDPNLLDKMSKEEKLKLLFLPGLSTKEEVTELSGRGVGTDAVKKIIDELGGQIRLSSELGKGTTTTLELPLSVALTNVFHIQMNRVNYAIAMDNIVETEKISSSDIKTAGHKPFVRLRGELVPLLFEKRLLGQKYEIKEEIPIVVVVAGEFKFALVVDEFMGQLDVMQKPLTGVFNKHPFISGTSLLGNGDVLFMIDPKKLVGIA